VLKEAPRKHAALSPKRTCKDDSTDEKSPEPQVELTKKKKKKTQKMKEKLGKSRVLRPGPGEVKKKGGRFRIEINKQT